MSFLSRAIAAFKLQHNKVDLLISQSGISDIIHGLREQRIDLGVMALTQFQRSRLEGDILFRTLFTNEMCIACSPAASIASMPYVTPQDLVDYTFVLHKDPVILENLKYCLRR